MRAVQHALACDAGQQPGQLGDLGNVGLAVERDALRVQPGGQPACRDLQRRALNACRLIAFDQCMVVGQKIKALHTGQAAGGHGWANRADEVAEVWRAGGGDAGEEALKCLHHHFTSIATGVKTI